MTQPDLPLTPRIQQEIVAFLRAGGFAEVAAEAAGVPAEVFHSWLRRGRGDGAEAKYREFERAVRQAQAQARLAAETVAFKEKPLDWLKFGPGRDTSQVPGWATPARPGTRDPSGADLLAHPEVQQLVAVMLEALDTYPEARLRVAGIFGTLANGRTHN